MNKRITSVFSVVLTLSILLTNVSNVFAFELSRDLHLLAANSSNHSNNRYYFDPVLYTVNTGKDNGFSGQNAINVNDPHSGWQLGRFYIEGYTDIVEQDGEIIILKNVGDEISFGYILEQDIDCLNGDDTLSINYDKNCTDSILQIPRQDFGRGALFVRQTDYQGYTDYPVTYMDFLSGCSVGADTSVEVFEEGDYNIALDYEIKDGRSWFGQNNLFGATILPTYTNYRYSFNFKVRNSNCMAYPMDSNNTLLYDGDTTSDGFTLDLARSRYLFINVKYSAIVNGRAVVRSNRTASDGDLYEDEGIYELTISNQYTGRTTDITIFVGDSPALTLYAQQYNGIVVEEPDATTPVPTGTQVDDASTNSSIEDTTAWLDSLDMSSPELQNYLDETVFQNLVNEFDGEFYISGLSVQYLDQEYLDELSFNSMPNVFYGYTLEELDEIFEGNRYVFTVNENNETEAQLLETYGNVDIYDSMLTDVTVGAGVIIICVTGSYVAAPFAPQVSLVLACAASRGGELAIATAAISGISAALISGYETGDFDLAADSALVSAADGFKWGAIIGSIEGAIEGINVISAADEAAALAEDELVDGAAEVEGEIADALSLSDAASIQSETGWRNEIISRIHSMEEYEVYSNANMAEYTVGDLEVIAPEIDWSYVDSAGRTNAERVLLRDLSPITPDGFPYNAHHIGQSVDSPFAILSHRQHYDNYSILHWNNANSTASHGSDFAQAKIDIYNYLLQVQAPDIYAALIGG